MRLFCLPVAPKGLYLAVFIENRRTVHFITPENIEVTYELAGIGSRFVAAAIDHVIQFSVWLIIALIASQMSRLFSLGGMVSAPLWIQGLVAVATFLIIFGYFVFFELRMGGQTPGKRVARLRVVRDGGYPIDPYSSIIRNLVRIVDLAAPPPYGAGLLSIFVSKDYKRLGDFAAGTIVIKERPAVEPPQPSPTTSIASQLMPYISDAGLLTPEAIESMLREQLKAQRVDELFAAMDRMAAVDEPPAMSPEEVAEEIRVMRAERRAKAAG